MTTLESASRNTPIAVDQDDLLASLPQTFGNYLEKLPPFHEQLTLDFSPSSAPPRKRWRNNGRSADFLADFLVTCLPEVEIDADRQRQSEIKDAVSYIANELLENAMKYSDQSQGTCTRIHLYFDGSCILFLTQNNIEAEAVQPFQVHIQELLEKDSQELYISRLEKSVELDNNDSGLGLLTMMNDYEAKLSWKFEQVKEGCGLIAIAVTTMVQLEI